MSERPLQKFALICVKLFYNPFAIKLRAKMGNCLSGTRLGRESGVLPQHYRKNSRNRDELYERARIQWILGEWLSLAELTLDNLVYHLDRAEMALWVTVAHQQLNNHDAARDFVMAAKLWGCDNRLLRASLIMSLHNTMGRLRALNRNFDESLDHFHLMDAISHGNQYSGRLGSHRAITELIHLGLSSDAIRYLKTK